MPKSNSDVIMFLVYNMNEIVNNNDMQNNWKSRSQKYLLELECFMDKVESIKDEDLKKEIIIQMLKCDKELSILAEKLCEEEYKRGVEEGRKNIK